MSEILGTHDRLSLPRRWVILSLLATGACYEGIQNFTASQGLTSHGDSSGGDETPNNAAASGTDDVGTGGGDGAAEGGGESGEDTIGSGGEQKFEPKEINLPVLYDSCVETIKPDAPINAGACQIANVSIHVAGCRPEEYWNSQGYVAQFDPSPLTELEGGLVSDCNMLLYYAGTQQTHTTDPNHILQANRVTNLNEFDPENASLDEIETAAEPLGVSQSILSPVQNISIPLGDLCQDIVNGDNGDIGDLTVLVEQQDGFTGCNDAIHRAFVATSETPHPWTIARVQANVLVPVD